MRKFSMLWVRLRSKVVERLGPRLLEWEHAVILIAFGMWLMQPPITLGSVPNEDVWGACIFVLGVVRLASLIINGFRQRVTASLRAVSAFGSSLVFVLIGIGYVYSGQWGSAAVFFPVIAAFELFNYARAMRDVGRTT